MRRYTWLVALLCSPAFIALTGCGGNPPTVEKGAFAEEKTFSIRRGLIDVIVDPGGNASYFVRQWPYTHPMGQPGDTEIVVTTPAGKITIDNRDLGGGKFRINGKEYDYQPPEDGRMTMRIDRAGKVSMVSKPRPEKKDKEEGLAPKGK